MVESDSREPPDIEEQYEMVNLAKKQGKKRLTEEQNTSIMPDGEITKEELGMKCLEETSNSPSPNCFHRVKYISAQTCKACTLCIAMSIGCPFSCPCAYFGWIWDRCHGSFWDRFKSRIMFLWCCCICWVSTCFGVQNPSKD